MLQLAHEQRLSRLRVPALGDVAGDGVDADRLAERIEHELGVDLDGARAGRPCAAGPVS